MKISCNHNKVHLGVLVIILAFGKIAMAQTMTVSGSNWTVPVSIITEAGKDYANSGVFESATNQILITATVPLLLGQGNVSAHYQPNPTWNNNLLLSIKRTGNGTSLCVLCTITGNTDYLTLTQNDLTLFNINAILNLAKFNNIPMQIKLSGVSATVPTGNYTSSIVFTISSN